MAMATKEDAIESFRGMSGLSRALPTRTLPSPIKVVVADMATCHRESRGGAEGGGGGEEKRGEKVRRRGGGSYRNR